MLAYPVEVNLLKSPR
uniref:Uncharacterized protein n=1 Tax=Anguilla anguilla TaxID=7936 RepID=A0A0E9TVW2_ANGAN